MKRIVLSVVMCLCAASAIAEGQKCMVPADERLFLLPCLRADVDQVVMNIGYGIGMQTAGLAQQIQEMANSLKTGGIATVVAPASHGVIFTQGMQNIDAIYEQIDAVLSSLEESVDAAKIQEALQQLTGVTRATFVMRAGKLTLVTEDMPLVAGETVWRKEGDQVHATPFYREEDYLSAFKNANLVCTEVAHPCFFGLVKYRQYHEGLSPDQQLSSSYMDHNPFTIFTVEKRAS